MTGLVHIHTTHSYTIIEETFLCHIYRHTSLVFYDTLIVCNNEIKQDFIFTQNNQKNSILLISKKTQC